MPVRVIGDLPYGSVRFPYGSVWDVRRSRDDWTELALRVLAEGGVAALAVEPLAARGGSTKGSVYWHFATRAALVRATLERWEHEHTEAVIAAAERGATPAERLRLLFESVPAPGAAVELALHASLADPLVAAAVARVGRRRVEYLTGLYSALGFTPARARERAVVQP